MNKLINSTQSIITTSAATIAFHWSLIIIGSATVAMNFLFSSMFWKFRKDLLTRNNNNKILLNMTIADGLVGIFCIALGSLLIMNQPQIVYKLIGIVPLFSSMFTSIFLLGILTVDRLVAIKLPLQYKDIMHRGRVLKLLVFSWLVAGIIALQEGFVYIFISWRFELKLRGILLFLIFTIGSLLLLISNIHLSFTIKNHVKFQKNQAILIRHKILSADRPSESGYEKRRTCLQLMNYEIRNAKETTFDNEIRASKMCILITALFICCWAPLTAYRFSYSIGNRLGIPWLRRICLMMASMNSFLNPIVYLLTRKIFQTHMTRLFFAKFREHVEN